jgi:crotonobetainyl-CoA:carnitine CoA-transferase CaiB-like acyl-CoA transferase
MAGVLSNVRVLDITRYLAGPLATQMLGDMGAEVIKVERPNEGDVTRTFGPPFAKDRQGKESRESTFFLGVNRGKKSVTVDIATPEGQEIIKELVKSCDVLIENYKVGTLTRYGLGYDVIKAIKPDIIYCSITGFGQEGPYRDRAGFDPIIQAMSGFMSINGVPDGEPGEGPIKAGIALADIVTGLNSVIAILGALNHKNVKGEGQFIDLALLDVMVATLTSESMKHLVLGEIPTRLGRVSRNLAPTQTFETQDGMLSLAIPNDQAFAKFMQLIGKGEMAKDEKYRTNAARKKSRLELVGMLEAMFETKPTKHWVDLIAGEGIPCGPVNNFKQVWEDPQVNLRNMRVDLPHTQLGTIPTVASPLRFSATPVEYTRASPLLGEHTRDILMKYTKLDAAALDALTKKGVI